MGRNCTGHSARTTHLGSPQIRESGPKVLVHPNANRNRPDHRHQRGPQKVGELDLSIPIHGTRALVGFRPLQTLCLRHGVIRQIEPLGRWQTMQARDEGALEADQIIGHVPCTRMIHHPVKRNSPPSHLNFGQKRDLQLRPLLLHQDLEARGRLNLSQESSGCRTE